MRKQPSKDVRWVDKKVDNTGLDEKCIIDLDKPETENDGSNIDSVRNIK